jgi:nucleoside-diphosphate-sugar epimerase
VYGPVEGTVGEDAPRPHTGDEYGDSKLDAELVCEEFIARGLPCVILRPTVVYGPFSKQWIVKFAERLESGLWAQFGKAGDGRCNPVYVMDLVRAIVQAIDSDAACGKAFNINGPEVISWNEYFATLNDALRLPPLRGISRSRSQWRAMLTEPPRWVARQLLRTSRPLLTRMRQQSPLAKRMMDAGEKMLKNTPSTPELSQFGQNAVYSCERARRTFHYEPTVDFREGMRRSTAWLLHERPPFPGR